MSNRDRAWHVSAVLLLRDASGDVMFCGHRIERRHFAETLAAVLDHADDDLPNGGDAAPTEPSDEANRAAAAAYARMAGASETVPMYHALQAAYALDGVRAAPTTWCEKHLYRCDLGTVCPFCAAR